MKKLSLIAAILVLALLLCACGGSSDTKVKVLPAEERTVVFGEFEAKTVGGGKTDETVFADYQLTMVNIWGTFCSPCIQEMPELKEIAVEYADKGVAVVGIPADITDKDGNVATAKLAEAKDIIETTGADYLHIIPCKAMIEAKIGSCQTLPETVFLDSEGRQVGGSYMGAKTKAEWIAIIDALLEAMA